MNQTPRKVKLSTIINLLKKRPIPVMFGTMFTLFPLFFILLFFIISSSFENDVPAVNYDLINANGKNRTAIITNIETVQNVTINDVHPTIISYKYNEDGKKIEFKNQVLEVEKIEGLAIGDRLQIKTYQGKSIIEGMKPDDFTFTSFTFLIILFLLIGLPFLIYAILSIRNELNLYKYGVVAEGKIISMIPKSGMSFSSIGNGIYVHYSYITSNGSKIIGESITTDFSIINDKKKDDFFPIFISSENNKKSCVVPKLDSLRNNWNIEFD